MSTNKTKDALIRNMKKYGWAIEGNEGTLPPLKIVYGEKGWTLFKDNLEVGSAPYGRNQLREIKKVASDVGYPFGETKKSPKTKHRETISNTTLPHKSTKAKQAEALAKAKKASETLVEEKID